MKILQDARWVEEKVYSIDFDLVEDPSSGYSFDADGPDFNPVFGNDIQKKNYRMCVENPETYDRVFRVRTHRYREPAIGLCACGNKLLLVDRYRGACQCDCGRWYNIYGQSLIDPEYWEEDY